MAPGRLVHLHLDDDTDLAPSTKRRKVASSRIERPRGVAAQFRQTDISDIHEVFKMFDGREFCVVNGPRDFPKEEIERKIAEHRGTFVQNPGPETFAVLVHKVIVRANNIISTGLYDVLKVDWLQECLSAECCLPFLPTHMLHTSPATAAKFAEQYNQYGDSFTEDATEDSLRAVFKKVEEKSGDRIRITPEEIALVETRYFPDDSPMGLFRQCRDLFDKYLDIGNPSTAIPACSLDVVGLELREYGGVLEEHLSETVTHVLFDKRDLSRVAELRRVERGHHRKHHFVTSEWVRDSIESGYLKNERLYEPRT